MGTKWHLGKLLRFGMRTLDPQFSQVRFRGRRTVPLGVKAVFDEAGSKVDGSRLGLLKQTMETNESNQTMPNRYKITKPGESKWMEPGGNNGRNHESNKEVKPGHKKDAIKRGEFDNAGPVETFRGFGKRTEEPKPTPELPDQTEKVKKVDRNVKKEEERGFHVPRYTKINGWETETRHVKELGRMLTSKRDESDYIIVEGTRLLNEALEVGLCPSIFLFSRVGLLRDIKAEKLGKECECYHIPYENIKLWSDLKTPPGTLAAFSKADVEHLVKSSKSLPMTLVCDNIRTPDNLGAIMRVAAAAGVARVILTRGCVDPWSSKVLRAAAGAHFLVPIVKKVGWEVLENYIPEYPQVVLADMVHELDSADENIEKTKEKELLELDSYAATEGFQHNIKQDPDLKYDLSYLDDELTARYRQVPVSTAQYSQFTLNPGCKETVVVVGGETEGVSDAAYKFCHKYNGSRLYIPLMNNANSLNVISAASIVMFRVQQSLLEQIQSSPT